VRKIFRPLSRNIPLRKVIRIYSDGDTEIDYFNSKKREISERCARTGRRNIKIIPIHEKSGITRILKTIQKNCPENDLNPDDKVYCILDVDDLPDTIIQTSLNSKPEYIDVIFSNPNFELWLLLHFKYYNHQFSKDETLTKLKDHLPGYSKPNIEPIFSELKAKENTAIHNAKQLRIHHSRENTNLNSRSANPHTHMDIVVELLNSL